MQISKSVYIVNGGYYGNLGNVYAVRGKESVLLIDTGELVAVNSILDTLRYWGIGDMPISYVLATHGHQDHMGSAAFFQKRGSKIICGEGDAWQLRKGGLIPEEYPGLIWQYDPCEPDQLLRDGDTFRFEDFEFNVIGVPGHTDGSLVYSLQDGEKLIFFTGDTVICDGERGEEIILGWPGDPTYDSRTYIKSLEKLYKYYPDYVLGGHGIPCLADGNRVLRNACLKALLTLR